MGISYEEYMRLHEGLPTTLKARAQGGPSTAKLAANVAADFVPGAGLALTGAEYLWNVLSGRRERLNFSKVMERVQVHKAGIQQAGANAEAVFHIDDDFAKALSDHALHEIMAQAIAYLDRSAQKGYQGVPENLVSHLAHQYISKFTARIHQPAAAKTGSQGPPGKSVVGQWQMVQGKKVMQDSKGRWWLDDQAGRLYVFKDGNWEFVKASS